VMCGRPSQQSKKHEMACVRNKLFSLARIVSKESQSATTVTSGDSGLPDANARTPRYATFRRDVAERCGFGFKLPGILPNVPNCAEEPEVENAVQVV
jgi:hypothetical protein